MSLIKHAQFFALGLAFIICFPAQAEINHNDSSPHSTISTLLEAGPSYKIFGAKDDQKKIINAGIFQSNGLFFHSVNLGGWIGGRDTSSIFSYNIGATLGHISVYGGYGYISDKSNSIGTHWGFSLGTFVELNQVIIGYKHYSNGAKLFDHDKHPNYGLNFLTLGVRV